MRRRSHFQISARAPASCGSAVDKHVQCSTLAVFAHSAGRLNDLRIYSGDGAIEVPFAQTTSGEAGTAGRAGARGMNLGRQGKRHRLRPRHAAAPLYRGCAPGPSTAEIFTPPPKCPACQTASAPKTELGQWLTLFDLRSQGLSRSTLTLPLQESSFPLLHVELTVTPGARRRRTNTRQPEMVRGAIRAAQPRGADALYDGRRHERPSSTTEGPRIASPGSQRPPRTFRWSA